MENLTLLYNKIKDIDYKISNKIDIIYSITVHESIECIFDQIYNIYYFNKNISFLIILHPNQDIYNKLLNYTLPSFVLLNDKPFSKNKYTYSILKGHIENYNYVKNYNYNFFCLLASNCMFVKSIDINNIYKLVKDTSKYTQNYIECEYQDNTIDFIKNDEILEIFKNKNIYIKKEYHEGAIYKKEMFKEIINFIHNNKIEELIKIEFTAEEILLASVENYLCNQVNTRICKMVLGGLPRQKHIDEIIKTNKYFLIKKVPRVLNHRVRLLIRNLYNK